MLFSMKIVISADKLFVNFLGELRFRVYIPWDRYEHPQVNFKHLEKQKIVG